MSKSLSAWFSVVVLLLGCVGPSWAADPAAPPPQTETQQQRDARMAWFRDAKFGLFIHWGVYSVPAGEWKDHKDYAEWFLEQTHMPVSQYEKYRDQFNPVKFDAKQWVAVAKEAGVKYLVITSKHHDGFAMFDTKLTDWGIMSSPFHRDPMKELAAACREAGIKFCFYHSIMDWHHPDYIPRRAWNDVAKAQGEPQFDRYVKFMKGQLKELLTNYGPLGILWFDGEWENTWTHERGKDLEAYVRGLQPDIIVNNRVGKNREGMKGLSKGDDRIGDYGTPEQEIPAGGLPGVDWESCMTMNDHWGYNKNDQNWKSAATMIRMLIDVASKGGNLLMNVGPTSEGLIPGPSVERLREIGKWMKLNGEAIYGTRASPFSKAPAWGRVTQKPGTLYLHVFDWPKDGRLVLTEKGIGTVAKAYLLADLQRAPLEVTQNQDGLTVAVPAQSPDPVATVVVLEIPPGYSAAPAAERTPPAAEWEKLKYGMFVHFGMSTFEGIDISEGKSPSSTYAPTQLDVRQWVRTAKRAGMTYMVLTAKHVPGHCLWPAEGYDYSVATSGNKTDVVAEFMKACKEEAIKPGLYYCVLDSRNEGGVRWQDPVGDDYFRLIKRQLAELHTRYPGICEQWIDVPQKLSPQQRQELYGLIKGLNPECLVLMNAACVNGVSVPGRSWPTDLLDGEQTAPPPEGHHPVKVVGGKTYYLPMEVCDTICRNWFWTPDDRPKTVRTLYKLYAESVGRGANLLLNVPPDKSGRIPQEYVDALMELKRVIDDPALLGQLPRPESLSFGCRATASSVLGHHPLWAAENAVDDDPCTCWKAREARSRPGWRSIWASRPASIACG